MLVDLDRNAINADAEDGRDAEALVWRARWSIVMNGEAGGRIETDSLEAQVDCRRISLSTRGHAATNKLPTSGAEWCRSEAIQNRKAETHDV